MSFKLIIFTLCFYVSYGRHHHSTDQEAKSSSQCPAGFSGTNCQDECGKIYTDNNLRITHGVEANAHSWPAIALIKIDYKGEAKAPNGSIYDIGFLAYCDGTLIDRTTVLTAAHCLPKTTDIEGTTFDITLKPSMLTVYLGYQNVSAIQSYYGHGHPTFSGGVTKKVASFKANENFDDNLLINDIGLIKLDSEVTLSETIQLGCLPPAANFPDDSSNTHVAYLAGWGETETKELPGTLMNVKIYIFDHQVCTEAFPDMTDNQICAAAVESNTHYIEGSCQGDSGGALYVYSKTANRYYIAGVVSYGAEGCNYYSVFTRVGSYLDWIEKNRY